MGFGHLRQQRAGPHAYVDSQLDVWLSLVGIPRHIDELQGDGPLLATMTVEGLRRIEPGDAGASRSARTKPAGGEIGYQLSGPLICRAKSQRPSARTL